MSSSLDALTRFLAASREAALVEIVEVKGSAPREAGAYMLVSADALLGTIGGGQLEFQAIAAARRLLAEAAEPGSALSRPDTLTVPLGPEIGQCCGGQVGLSLRTVDAVVAARLTDAAAAAERGAPRVYVFGGGHVGQALAAALALLPVNTMVVETRADALDGMPPGVTVRLAAVPEEVVREAPPGSAFVVLTHDHALDFLIVAEALARDDAAYVGMIGSKTKKATFRSWYLKTAGGSASALGRLVSPIGGSAVKDKRPSVIAALATAEILTSLCR
jgi:xanthine dehydrogenase accessory factor